MFSTFQKIVLIVGVIFTLLAVWVLSINSTTQATLQSTKKEQVKKITFNTTESLQKYFTETNYNWPIESLKHIPEETLTTLPNDINSITDAKSRKILFIQIMLPIIQAEKKHIRTVRKTVEDKLNRTGNNAANHEWFKQLLKEYNVKSTTFIEQRKNLLNRLDELPTTLILAQAAIESGWGTSRFAREGNSLFGQWTFSKKGGITPEKREAGKSHQVQAFDSIQASVRSYIKNLNRNRAYKELREYRNEMRQNNKPYDAFKLAEGLHRYSQKGKKYVDILHTIMRSDEFKVIHNLEA